MGPPVDGHGRMMNPASRASQWRVGFDNPPDYNDNQGFCGGSAHQHQQMGGKCGICGDPYDGPWPHEAPGGRYANGHITKEYKQGQEFDIAIDITTNHKGHFNFRLCPWNNVHQDPKQDCFEQHLLKRPNGDTDFMVTTWDRGYWNSTWVLPAGVTCDQCILQWTYTAANSWAPSLMELLARAAVHRRTSEPALISPSTETARLPSLEALQPIIVLFCKYKMRMMLE